MSKASQVAETIEELRHAATVINSAADWLSELFADKLCEENEPASEPELTLEQVRVVLADKSRQGFTADIRSLLQKYGSTKLSGIDQSNYRALLFDVEGLTNAT